MTRLNKLFIKVLLFTVVNSSLKAQDDITGIYVDDKKVEELSCFSFGDMDIIFPLDKLKSFDAVNVYVSVENNRDYQHASAYSERNFSIQALELLSFKHNGVNYVRIPLFKKGSQKSEFYVPWTENYHRLYQLVRGSLSHHHTASDQKELKVLVGGLITKGYVEKYNLDCKCVVKEPTYNGTEFKKMYLPLKNSTKLKGFMKTLDKVEVDLSAPCEVKGQKLEINK